MRATALKVFSLTFLLLQVPGIAQAQIVPVSQSRSIVLIGCGANQQASAAGFEAFTNGFDTGCGNGSTFGEVGQRSSIDPSLISAYGQAFGQTIMATNNFSVTFSLLVPCTYNLTGILQDHSSFSIAPAMPPLILSGPTGIVYEIQIPVRVTSNFVATGTLPPGQYTIQAGAVVPFMSHANLDYLYSLSLAITAVPFQITAITQQGNDILLTWTAFGGTTNIAQATSGAVNGSYLTNFTTISPLIIIPGTNINVNVTTNYLDVGGAVTTSRYYRVRRLP